MGTKNAPGQFDCYAKAAPDEPLFVLLARDPLAPTLVEQWAYQRMQTAGPDDPKIEEAFECAAAMRRYFATLPPKESA